MKDDTARALGAVCSAWPALLPPTRMSVAEGAERYFYIKRPGAGAGPWSRFETPYMVEPMNTLANRRFSAVCFVGPSQSGKTAALGEGWLAHAIMNDPGDMLIVQMTQDKAREYSKQRIDRLIRNSPDLRAMRSSSPRDDNLHDKQFRHGMWARIAWPTATNLSSTSYRYVFGTDYDRWPDDVSDEGDAFGLMMARIRTFLSRGKVCVESSPGRPIVDPSWAPVTPHEAPPVGGILGVYNRSDRRRLYWACPHCEERFEATPGLSLFRMPSDDELLEDIRTLDIDRFARQHARVACPHCGAFILPEHREAMNRGTLEGRGGWLPDGVHQDARGRLSGTPRNSTIAGFWLGGIAASYIPWHSLITKHLQALLEFELTGNEFQLQTTANTDQGVPYMSRALVAAARGDAGTRHDTGVQRYVVPDWTRFVVAAVDVQGGRNARFIVQVHAVGEHQQQQLVDRRAITMSKRPGMADGEFAPLDPASYGEDWDVLTEQVVLATYRTSVEGREIRVKCTVVDSGGEDGVTDKAYAWRARLRKHPEAHKRDVRIAKGEGGKFDWFVRETEIRGGVTLHRLNANKFKDMVQAGLQRSTPGPGYYFWPPVQEAGGWVPQAFFDELKAEVRNADGTWSQVKKRNETLDLCYMIRAACMMLGTDRSRFWDRPPPWALPLDQNSEVITTQTRREEAQGRQQAPAPAPPKAPSERRVRRSAYLEG